MHLLIIIRDIQQWEHYPIFTEVTPYDAFDEINKVVLDGISKNTASLVESRNMVPLTQLIHHQMVFMLSCLHQKHIHFKITQKLMEKL